jgi:hypothetical protein
MPNGGHGKTPDVDFEQRSQIGGAPLTLYGPFPWAFLGVKQRFFGRFPHCTTQPGHHRIHELLLFQELKRRADNDTPPAPLSVLLNLTGETTREGWRPSPGGRAVCPVVVNLKDESANELLGEIDSGRLDPAVLAWLPLTPAGGEPESIAKCLELVGREPSPERRRQIRDFTLIFAERSKKLVRWQGVTGVGHARITTDPRLDARGRR